MIFLLVLTLAFLALQLTVRDRLTRRGRWRVAMAVAMVIAGLSHLLNPTPFIQHLPVWVPGRHLVVLLSGVLEIALGGALFLRRPRRRQAGVALAAFLVSVFPANVYVAVSGVAVDGQPGGLYPWLRLPLQFLFVWLALWSTRDIESRRYARQRAAARGPRA